MPIYMKVEGIKGTVKAEYQAGGANFTFGDGSVRNISRSSGHKFTLERHYDGSGSMAGAIEVSRIALPNSSSGAIDALAPNAVADARALFEAQRSMVTSLGVVFAVAASGANKFRCVNNLRQMSLAACGQIATVRFFITDGGNRTGVTVELENCLITSYSLGGHGGGGARAGELFKASLVGEGKKVRIDM
jgi:prepilin-type processing-associated H-X9-DG protein